MSSVDQDDFDDMGAKRCITPEDIVRVTTASDPISSPNGEFVAFVRTKLDEKTMKKSSSIYVVSTQTDQDGHHKVRQITSGPSDCSPCWSGDSKSICFLRNSQAWLISLEGGEAYQLTNFAVDINNLDWAPQHNVLSFTAHVYLEDDSFQDTKDRDEKQGEWRKYDELMVHEWDRWMTEKRSHLFVVPIEHSIQPGDDVARWRLCAPPRDLMNGVDADCPPHQTFGGREHVAWSQDGNMVCYTCKPRSIDAAWSVNTVLHLASIEADTRLSAAEEFLGLQTTENQVIDTCPSFSPDGKYLAYLSSKRAGYEADRLEIVLYEIGTRSLRRIALAPTLDVSIGEFVWADNATVLFACDHQAQHKVFSFNIDNEDEPHCAIEFGSSRALCVARTPDMGNNKMIFVHSTLCQPPELCSVDLEQAIDKESAPMTPLPLTHANAALVEALELPEPKSLSIVGANGQDMHCWLAVPPRAYVYDHGKNDKVKFPVMLLAHGGPQGAWDNSWHSRWNIQVWTAQGFACVVPNFTGSTGFGQAYTDAISKNWDLAAKDCLLAVDHCLETFDFLDKEQQFAMGASFGGWMMMFLNGLTDNRFKCLVAHDGVFDLNSMYYETDELWFPEWELGTPTSDAALYRRLSPSSLVSRWQTPIMLIHGGKDFRCPLSQSLSAHAAARRRGVRSQLIVCDEASHWVTAPKAALQWHALINDFLNEFREN